MEFLWANADGESLPRDRHGRRDEPSTKIDRQLGDITGCVAETVPEEVRCGSPFKPPFVRTVFDLSFGCVWAGF